MSSILFSVLYDLVAMPQRAFCICLTLLGGLTGLVTSADAGNATVALGPSAFTVPGGFPTSAFRNYYNSPTATVSQVQPVISDPVNVCVGV